MIWLLAIDDLSHKNNAAVLGDQILDPVPLDPNYVVSSYSVRLPSKPSGAENLAFLYFTL